MAFSGPWDRRSGGPFAEPAGGLQTVLFVGCGVGTSCLLGGPMAGYSLTQHPGSRRVCGGGGCSVCHSSRSAVSWGGSLSHTFFSAAHTLLQNLLVPFAHLPQGGPLFRTPGFAPARWPWWGLPGGGVLAGLPLWKWVEGRRKDSVTCPLYERIVVTPKEERTRKQ